ncbi:MAG: FAD-dependent oxidoreductase, partial [Planctomycetota bacterium]|nr:FAD-dependent oxidoreductase [Planctomycetota bacterium]
MIREARTNHDIAIVGGTPAGIMAAVAAARSGKSVVLLESGAHLGGMSTSGLGKSDIETRVAIGGLFKEFVSRVRHHYVEVHGADSQAVRLCRDGYYYEPSVAERVFNEMLGAEVGIEVFLEHRL